MIVDYDKNPLLPIEKQLQSLAEGVQREFDEILTELDRIRQEIEKLKEEIN